MDHFTNDGYRFEVTDNAPPARGGAQAPPSEGEAVILLHGFPEDRESWAGLTPVLNGAGYRTLTFDQRGYSPEARPPERSAYRLRLLAGDVLALADQAGADRFHLIGHDWGAALAWHVAAHHPERLMTVTALSVPPPQAMLVALRRSTQALHSWYMVFFQIPRVPERVLAAGNGSLMKRGLRRSGLDAASAERYARRAASPGAMTGPINWYRAMRSQVSEKPPPIGVPALYIWGDQDGFVSRVAAQAGGRFVTGPYRFEILEGGSHWIPEVEAARTASLVLPHLAGPH